MASSSDLAVKFMTMVENKRFEGIGSMESFFEKRASDFATLEVKGDEDGGKLVVVGEHELIWTEHHKAYTSLVEEALGIPKFCEDNGCDEKELFASTEILVRENPDVQMFLIVNVTIITITIWKLPYLTHAEENESQRSVQTQYNKHKRQKCSLKRCGVSNSLEIALLSAEVFMGLASLLNHITLEALADELGLELMDVDAGNTSTGYSFNLTSTGNQNITTSDPKMGITTQLFEEKYPGLAAFTAILEWVGIIIIFLGFFVLLSEIFRAGCYTLRQRKLYWRQLKAERANRKFALSNTLNSKSAHVMEVTPATPKHRTSESEGGKLVDNYEDEQNLANDMLSMEKDKQKRSLERRLKARRKKNKKSKVQPMSIEQTVESDTAGLKDSDALKVHPSTSKNAKEASVREPEESSKIAIGGIYCAILALFVCGSRGTTLRSAPRQIIDPSPLESARNAVNQIATVNQPQSEYLESQPLDVNDRILTNKQGSLLANDNLYTMPDDPDHQVKESNPNNFNDYYKEEEIPEPPPLPKVQEGSEIYSFPRCYKQWHYTDRVR
eukprot:g12055.t1